MSLVFLINKREITGSKHFNDPKGSLSIQMIRKMFIRTLMNTIQVKKRKVLILFDDMIADMINKRKIKPSSNRTVY